MALVVRCPHTLQVKATRIRRRGDFVKSDQGSVDTSGLSAPPALLAVGGPSMPDPVVQPLPVAALTTIPMAASCRCHTGTRSADISLNHLDPYICGRRGTESKQEIARDGVNLLAQSKSLSAPNLIRMLQTDETKKCTTKRPETARNRTNQARVLSDCAKDRGLRG